MSASTPPARFEIKLNFGAAQIEKAMQVFGIAPDKGKDRRIWFGDIRDGLDGLDALPLSGRGVILRVRAKKNGGDVTLKLRGPDGCLDVDTWRMRTGAFGDDAKIEGDWAGRRLVSASLSADLDDAARASLGDPDPSVTDLLSAEQRQLAGDLLVPLAPVTLLGPITAKKWDPNDDHAVAAELWTVDDLRFLEISIVTDDDPEKAQAALEQRATDGGLTLTPGQETKTSTVLKHLASR